MLRFGSPAANAETEFRNSIDLNGIGASVRMIDVAAGAGGDFATLSGAITNSDNGTYPAGIIKSGNGRLRLTGANTYDGVTTISAGTLEIGGGGASGSVTGNILDNSSLVFNRSDSLVYSGSISGSGTVTISGAGIVTLSGANTYGGLTTISAGTLQIGGGGASGSVTGNILDNSNLVFNRSDSLVYSGSISGSGTVTNQRHGGGHPQRHEQLRRRDQRQCRQPCLGLGRRHARHVDRRVRPRRRVGDSRAHGPESHRRGHFQ